MPPKNTPTALPRKPKQATFQLNPVLTILLFTVAPLITGLLINI